jgi:DNA-directed RNA polymerase omega subunit
LRTPREIDSKFRFVILASKRAKQLLRGDKPKMRTKARNPIRIAQEEVQKGMIHFEFVEPKAERVHLPEEDGFIGEVIAEEGEEAGGGAVEVGEKEKEKVEEEVVHEEEEKEEEEEEEEEVEELEETEEEESGEEEI